MSLPSDPAQEPEAVGYVSQQTISECAEGRGGSIVGAPAFETTIPLYTRPVSLDRETVKKALEIAYNKFLDANPAHTNHRMDYRDVTFDYWADAILALIEGRT